MSLTKLQAAMAAADMATQAAVDLTGPLGLDVTYEWGVASASNSITVAEAVILKPRTT